LATILDSGLVNLFSGIVIFLFVMFLVYGLLSWKKPMGENMGIYAIISLMIALLVSISDAGRSFIAFVTPWYVVLFIVVFMIFFIFTLFGVGSGSVSGGETLTQMVMGGKSAIRNWIMIFSVIILIAGLGFSFGPGLTPGGGAPPQPSIPYEDGQVIGQQPGQLNYPYQYPNVVAGGPAAGTPGSTATTDWGTNMINTIVHPKVLGLLVTLLIASLSVYFLSSGS